MKHSRHSRTILSAMLSVACVLTLAACGGGGGSEGTATATMAFTGGVPAATTSGFSSRLGPIGADAVHTLILTITKIELYGPNDDEEGNPLEVYNNSEGIDVDIKKLEDVSEILSTASVPAGKYTKIELHYVNPRLTLVGDEGNVIQDIQVTSDSRLKYTKNFTLEDGEASLIILSFGGIDLIETGSGSYVLRPHIDLSISFEPIDVSINGEITIVTPETMMIAVNDGQSERDVVVTDDTELAAEAVAQVDMEPVIVLNESDGGSSVPTAVIPASLHRSLASTYAINFEDLLVGDLVDVAGKAQVDGSVIADSILVLVPEEQPAP